MGGNGQTQGLHNAVEPINLWPAGTEKGRRLGGAQLDRDKGRASGCTAQSCKREREKERQHRDGKTGGTARELVHGMHAEPGRPAGLPRSLAPSAIVLLPG